MNKLEDIQVELLANWLRANNYMFTNIMNETGLPPKVAMIIGAKRKRLGLSKGFPDLAIILKRGALLFIEMKKKRRKKTNGEYYALSTDGIEISPEQQKWGDELNKIPNVQHHFAFGCDEAINIIKHLEICE